MDVHRVWAVYSDKTTLSAFAEASEEEMDKIEERLSFYKDHGAISDWKIERVERWAAMQFLTFEGLKREIDCRVDPKQRTLQQAEPDWPYDWPKPDV